VPGFDPAFVRREPSNLGEDLEEGPYADLAGLVFHEEAAGSRIVNASTHSCEQEKPWRARPAGSAAVSADDRRRISPGGDAPVGTRWNRRGVTVAVQRASSVGADAVRRRCASLVSPAAVRAVASARASEAKFFEELTFEGHDSPKLRPLASRRG